MVFRKPYAFFIKNFRKIHFILIILCGFIYSKTLQVRSLNKSFLTYLSYDSYLEPISKYLSIFLYFSLIITIIIFSILLIVLKRKNKPWKLYLIPVIAYSSLLILFLYTSSFYNNYDGGFVTTTVSALNNFAAIFTVPQYIVFLILIVRVLGLDIKNFNFSADEEFLELEQSDKEEFEISINIDKNSFKRNVKKTKRVIGYFYEEHKYICNVILIIFGVILLYKTYYYFGVSHKTIKENSTVNINGYSMMINKSFYTNKDKAGNIIEKNSAFVVLNLTVVNNQESRKFNGNDFHIVNGSQKYTFQGNTYSDSFSDLGNSFPIGKIKNNQKVEFALIFKVDKNLDYKRFVLYYQEYKGRISYLRKIKLNLNDISKIENRGTKKIGDKIKVNTASGETKSFAFESAKFVDVANYTVEACKENDTCVIETREVSVAPNKILLIKFSSLDYEGKELIKLSKDHGKIRYTDNDGFSKELKIEDAIESKSYLGKYLYIKVPNTLINANSIEFIYTIRNQKNIYKVK